MIINCRITSTSCLLNHRCSFQISRAYYITAGERGGLDATVKGKEHRVKNLYKACVSPRYLVGPMLLIFLVFVPASEYDSSAGLVESSVRIGVGTTREFGSELERQESLFVGWKVYSSSTNKATIYSYSIFVQQMYCLQDK
jgi:hypothetical protein